MHLPRPDIPSFDALPIPTTAAGTLRDVGIEVEFTGLSERKAARVIAQELGGTVREEDPHAYHVQGSALGNLSIELDVRHVHPQRRTGHPAPWLKPPASTWLGAALSPFVPRELVTGPLAITELGQIDRAAAVLRRAGAGGDRATPFGSLGLHFNVPLPVMEVGALLPLFQAYLVLEPWLRRGYTRGLLVRHFAPPAYPAAYVRKVLASDYQPDLPGFCDDYVSANPTRQRSLDLLPLLLHLYPDLGARRIVDKVKPRAVLHYRLPTARVGVEGWSIAEDWNRWVAVERLAGDPDRLEVAAARALHGDAVVPD